MADDTIDISERGNPDFAYIGCPEPGCRVGMTVHHSVWGQMLDRSCAEHGTKLKIIPRFSRDEEAFS